MFLKKNRQPKPGLLNYTLQGEITFPLAVRVIIWPIHSFKVRTIYNKCMTSGQRIIHDAHLVTKHTKHNYLQKQSLTSVIQSSEIYAPTK